MPYNKERRDLTAKEVLGRKWDIRLRGGRPIFFSGPEDENGRTLDHMVAQLLVDKRHYKQLAKDAGVDVSGWDDDE